jgi:hypothetical protein
MEYTVSDIVQEAKVALDENVSSTALSGLGDVDTLKLDEIVESKIVDAAMVIEQNAPAYMLDSGKAFGESIGWDCQPGYGAGYIHLPDDFMRLVCFQMSDWDYALTMAITEDSPQYQMQRSRFAGVRGNPQKPVVAITSQPIGLVLEFFSCYSGENAFIKKARYIPIPRIRNHKIDLCEKLKPAIVYYTAYLAALSLGNGDAAAAMLATARELAEISSDNA